ncbi:hypothetical protein D9M71_169400 [compost metagenome]
MLTQLVLHAHHPVAGGIGGDDEGADAVLAGGRVGHGEDHHHPGVFGGGDELLTAVQHIVVAVAARAGLQRAGIGARLRFGEGESTEHLAVCQRHEELAFLRLAAELGDGHAAHRVVHAHDGRAGTVAGGDFFQGQGQAHMAGLRTAPLFRHQHAEKAQLAHFLQGVSGEAVFAVPFGRKRA